MISLEDYKKALGSKVEKMTEEEIKNTKELQAKFARAIFDNWSRVLKTKSTNSS